MTVGGSQRHEVIHEIVLLRQLTYSAHEELTIYYGGPCRQTFGTTSPLNNSAKHGRHIRISPIIRIGHMEYHLDTTLRQQLLGWKRNTQQQLDTSMTIYAQRNEMDEKTKRITRTMYGPQYQTSNPSISSHIYPDTQNIIITVTHPRGCLI